MKRFEVSVDVTMNVAIDVEAENEEEAKKIALHSIAKDPHYYIRQNGNLLDREVYEVSEFKN
jgi:hypothetical protein